LKSGARTLETGLDGAVIIEPVVHGDDRGFFQELWKSSGYDVLGLPEAFLQTNVSRSSRGVLRGLHYQFRQPQGKLVSVLEGCIFDVAVDVRRGSASFGQWVAVELSADNHRQFYVPPGFAHGFLVLSDGALLHYQCTTEYAPQYDAAIAWDDPDIAVDWPQEPTAVSAKDGAAPRLRDVPAAKLPEVS